METVGIIALALLAAWVILGNGSEVLKNLSKGASSPPAKTSPQPAKKTCTKCGAKMDLEYRYCTVCGADLTDAESEVERITAVTKSTEKVRNLEIVVKALLVAGIICFFCPFVCVSCSGSRSEEVSMSGVELMIGRPLSRDMREEMSYQHKDSMPNPRVIIAFLLGVAAFGFTLSFNEKAPIFTTLLAIAAGIFLLLFREEFISFYGLTEDARYINIEYLWGWTTAVFSFFAGGLISAYAYKTGLC